jgi:3-oxoacyl-(acyl-carrier-protein) synthase/aryl carrier-like protein
VIHCAGLVDAQEPALVRKRVETMANVLEPKVKGLDTLLSCLGGEPLRFVLLFSSVSAAVPALAVGQSDYAMANAYMDYVAEAYAQRLPIVSIQWPSWKESGMGESRSTVYQGLGFLSHSDAQGLSMLDAMLARKPSAVVLPALVDAQRWKSAALTKPRIRQVPLSAPKQQDPLPQTNTVARRADGTDAAVLDWLTELLARELKLDPSRVDARTPLADYGVDSVMLMQLLKPVSERVGETLDPSILFEYPTLGQFARWLLERHAGAFAPAEQPAEQDAKQTQPQPQPLSAALAEVVVDAAPVPMNETRETHAADIAVIGMSCRFPGADDLAAFWALLAQGRSALRRVPPARWGASSDYTAGVLDRATYFDRAFFSISAEDARAMDPQALLALEQALSLWYAGGYRMEEIKGRAVGVYLGARAQVVADAQTLRDAHNPIMAVGANYMAANISRFFDLHGPSVVVDTACSSALVAMNMAIQALRDGDIESALVGGVSLFNGDSAFQMFEQRGILSREPSLHLFDGRASGTVLGEGAGMVWLKTLDQALRDGDTIHAVIRGIAVNNDGRTAGPAAPNLSSQKEVMQRALARSGLAPTQIEHIEVNGSGTLVTDLLELKAIEAVYRSGTSVPCELGSVKPNIGHPLCAEGIASFIKGVLTLHRRQRVPFLSASEPMAHYDLAASPFRFARALSERGDAPSIVAVNCFADGGTNAHVILQAWHDPQQRAPRRTALTPPSLNRVDCRAQVSGDGDGDGDGDVRRDERPEAASLVGAAVTGTGGAHASVWKRVVETV